MNAQATASRATERTRARQSFRPNVDILETADELTLIADMPGASAESIDVSFENGTLTLHANVEPRQPENTGFLVREYGVGDFHRAFEVSEAIDISKMSAEFRDGVLTLHLPKTAAVKPRKIEVKAS